MTREDNATMNEPPSIVPKHDVGFTWFPINGRSTQIVLVELDTTARPDVRDLFRVLNQDPIREMQDAMDAGCYYGNYAGPPDVLFTYVIHRPAHCEFAVTLLVDEHREYLERIAETGWLGLTNEMHAPKIMALPAGAGYVRDALASAAR